MSTTPFPPTSRYVAVEIAQLELPRSPTAPANEAPRLVPYVRRRFIAPPTHFTLLQEHTVAQGDRVDTLAAQYLGDPEQFWRLCDANAVMRPDELTAVVGQRIRITLPEGVPGISHG